MQPAEEFGFTAKADNFVAMKCSVKAFGIAREILDARELMLDLPDGATVAQLRQLLIGRYPRLGALTSLFIAVNTEYAPDDRLLLSGDEIALIPPVSGG